MTSARFRRAGLQAWFAGILFGLAPALRAGDAGKDWGVERESYVDPVTSVRVWELTKGTNAADNQGRLWLIVTATGNKRLLATGLRDKLRSVHAHASFDRLGRYVQFHTGRTHETVAVIDLNDLPPVDWTK